MKIRMLVDISGTINGRPYPRRGEVGDLPAVVADHLVLNRYAELAEPAKKQEPSGRADIEEAVETTSVDPVEERAVKSTGRTRKSSET